MDTSFILNGEQVRFHTIIDPVLKHLVVSIGNAVEKGKSKIKVSV